MQITVNGVAKTVPDGMKLFELFAALALKPDSTVVEYNGTVLDRAQFAGMTLAEGDSLELVRFVGGG